MPCSQSTSAPPIQPPAGPPSPARARSRPAPARSKLLPVVGRLRAGDQAHPRRTVAQCLLTLVQVSLTRVGGRLPHVGRGLSDVGLLVVDSGAPITLVGDAVALARGTLVRRVPVARPGGACASSRHADTLRRAAGRSAVSGIGAGLP